ncbi:helix-turn-helix domain-containing protein [Streptomyces qinglanensis]|uniref:helix-turn-helix domain-containing protein n=1 Tax=Streptomyces qinglanensis TaxID=943816 RepID=UPI003D71AA64
MPPSTQHSIQVRLSALLEERGISQAEFARQTGITPANVSKLVQGNVTAMWFSTLTAMCEFLGCQPGDLLVHVPAVPQQAVPTAD